MNIRGSNSGWLFADLLLALFLIFLAASAAGVMPSPRVTPSPSPSSPPSPTPVPQVCIDEVSTKPEDVKVVKISSPDGNLPSDDALRNAFAPFQGQRIGLVLTTVTNTQIGQAQTDAGLVNARLKTAVSGDVLKDAQTKDLGFQSSSGAGRGNVEFELYPFKRVCGPATPSPTP